MEINKLILGDKLGGNILLTHFKKGDIPGTIPKTSSGTGGGEPVGTEKQWKDGTYVKQTNGQWKKKGLPQENKVEQKKSLNEEKKEQPKGENQPKTINESNKENQPKVVNKEEGQQEPNSVEQIQEKLKSHITELLSSDQPLETKVSSLLKLGLTNNEDLVNLTGGSLSKILTQKEENKVEKEVKPETQKIITQSLPQDKLPTLDVNKRWRSYELFASMVVDGKRKGMIAYGSGGVGKTYTINQLLQGKVNKETGYHFREFDAEMDPKSDEYDYVTVGGKATPVGVYRALWEYNGKIIIFDDCDSVFDTVDGINMFKKVLDTSGSGVIDYASSSSVKDSKNEPIPQRFKFNGRVIFISNLGKEKFLTNPHLQALQTRTFTVDLTMNKEETIERLDTIKNAMPFEDPDGNKIDVSTEDRQSALDFIKKYADILPTEKLNARMLGSIALTKRELEANPDSSGLTWEEASLATLTS